MLQVACQCGKVLKVGDQFAGQRAVCPYCQAKVQLPGGGVEFAGVEAETASSVGRVIGREGLRRRFFLVWLAQWVLLGAGWAGVAWSLFSLMTYGLVWLDVVRFNVGRAGPSSWAVLAMLGPPSIAGMFTCGALLLAGSQLLPALAWFFIRRGIGGGGPFEGR